MYKTIAMVFALVLFSFSSASALSVADLQTQIKELLSKVEVLQQELKRLTTKPVESVISDDSRSFCKRIWNRALSQGVSGDDVRDLQTLLKEEGFFQADTSGFFGKATQEAVRTWQSENGIGSTGTVGPRTRALLKEWCNGEHARFAAVPQSGTAPLAVTFKTNVKLANPSMVADAGDYKIVFGDGSEYSIPCTGSSPWCEGVHVVEHTYQNAGEYTAKLVHYGYFGIPGDTERIVARRSISVGQVGVCTKEYAPVCGSYQVQCITTPCYPIEQTYSNTCMMKQAGATYLYSGECKMSGNKPPAIDEFSAPTTLQVNEVGTWKVSARDPENGSLTYRIDWGDSYVPYAVSAALRLDTTEQFVQETTFTHSYERAGKYPVTVYVRDSAGGTTKASATVQVGERPVACTLQYQPVCGQPAEPTCRFSNPACLMATPGSKTYGNKCQMNAEGATLLYEGECKTDYPVACTADARQCPDGSWTGRTGPHCQFICGGVVVN